MTDTTAKIRAKGCDSTGLTEDLALKLHGKVGTRIMAIVELKVDDAHNTDNRPQHVDLTIEQIEPAMEDFFDEHLRELTRTTAQNRGLKSDEDQLQIETQGDLARPLEDVVADGKAHLVDDQDDADDEADPDDPAYDPHPFDGREGYACAVCEQPGDAAVHVTEPADQEEPVPVA